MQTVKGVYTKKVKGLKPNFKPEAAAILTPKGKEVVAFFTVLATAWGAGDALAGSLLQDPRLNLTIKALTELLVKLGVKPFQALSGSGWFVANLDLLADTFFNEETAKRIKNGAISGRGLE